MQGFFAMLRMAALAGCGRIYGDLIVVNISSLTQTFFKYRIRSRQRQRNRPSFASGDLRGEADFVGQSGVFQVSVRLTMA
jgi:hypothetical protein